MYATDGNGAMGMRKGFCAPAPTVDAWKMERGNMPGLLEITPDGEIIGDDGEAYSLFSFDPESLGDEPLD